MRGRPPNIDEDGNIRPDSWLDLVKRAVEACGGKAFSWHEIYEKIPLVDRRGECTAENQGEWEGTARETFQSYCSDYKIYRRKAAAAARRGRNHPDLFFWDKQRGIRGLRSSLNSEAMSPEPPAASLWRGETESGEKFWEGAVNQVLVNKYERDPNARDACIARYEATCVICGFNFKAKFGPTAEGFIHVHHIKPISEIGEEYEINALTDLKPVCPNCHAVIHLGGKCRSIEEVRKLLEEHSGPIGATG